MSKHEAHSHICTDSVEDGEKLIQSALKEFGRIGECCVIYNVFAVFTHLRSY